VGAVVGGAGEVGAIVGAVAEDHSSIGRSYRGGRHGLSDGWRYRRRWRAGVLVRKWLVALQPC